MNCLDCEHFVIMADPIKADGGYYDLGQAHCTKHKEIVCEWGTKAWLKKLTCIEDGDGDVPNV